MTPHVLVFTAAVRIVALLASCGTIMSWGARWGWPFELACHFRLQYAWLSALGACGLAVAGHPPEAAIAAGFALVNLRAIAPLYARPTGGGADGPPIRALVANLYYLNRSYEALRRLIREVRPDIFVLVEASREWLTALEGFHADYPFRTVMLRPRRYGVLLYSRTSEGETDSLRVSRVGLLAVTARVRILGRWLTVIGAHPVSPVTPRRLRIRNRQLRWLAGLVRRQQGPLVLLGDLNTTSWSPAFQDLIRTTGLRDSRAGFGPQPTWPADLPPLRIPLDHCLVSSDVTVRARRVGPAIGSDHLPVLVECSINSGQPIDGRAGEGENVKAMKEPSA